MESTIKTKQRHSQVKMNTEDNIIGCIFITELQSAMSRTEWSLDDVRSCILNIVICFCALVQVVLQTMIDLEKGNLKIDRNAF